jgi:HlyD family secretion protein
MKKILIGITILLLLGTGFYVTRRPDAATKTTAQLTPTTMASTENILVAEAKVVPVQSAALSFSGGGRAAEVLVREGDLVQTGQPLVRLDRGRAEANVAQAEAQLAQAEAAYKQFRAGATLEELAAAEAQLRAAEAQLRQANGSVTASDRAAAEAQLAQAQASLTELRAGAKATDLRAAEAQLAQAQASLALQRDQLSAAKTNAQLQMEQRVTDLTKAQSAYVTANQNWQYVQDTGKDPNSVLNPATGKQIDVDLDDAQRQQYYDAYVQAEATLRSAEVAVQQAQVAFDTARQAEVNGIQLAEQQLASAQAGLDKLRAGADADALAAARAQIASSKANLDKLGGEQRAGALEAAQATVDQAQANLDRLRAGVSSNELEVAAAEIQSAQAALQLARVVLDETELRAPFGGTVAALDVKVGETVAPGTPIVHLADLATWQIETTDLTELDIVRVRPSTVVTVTFDAIPDLELPGTVSWIRALGESKQGDITYVVTITPDRQDERLHWNMTAAVRIPGK